MIENQNTIIADTTMGGSRRTVDLTCVAVTMRLALVELGKVLLLGFVIFNIDVQERVVVCFKLLVLWILG